LPKKITTTQAIWIVKDLKDLPLTKTPTFNLPQSNGQPVLTLDLDALAQNYTYLCTEANGAQVAGVVKANGYGCGAAAAASRLYQEGCRLFFVATFQEGLSLRAEAKIEEATVAVFNGSTSQEKTSFKLDRLTPVLNSYAEYIDWMEFWQSAGDQADYILHVDTGMNRRGMTLEDAKKIATHSASSEIPPRLVMSHLASADDPSAPFNAEQRRRFKKIEAYFPSLPRSLANSAGIFLGADYCLDVVRPGIALYGGQPVTGQTLPLKPVAHLHAPVIQIHDLEPGESVGYGQTFKVGRKSRIATLPLGYADGILRSIGNNEFRQGFAYLSGRRVPLVGRISMDFTTVDITDVAPKLAQIGTYVEILGCHISVDELGTMAGSFGYEILTGLGDRYRRQYLGNVMS
jgi:alanine racemase